MLEVRYKPAARRDFNSILIYIAGVLKAPHAAVDVRAALLQAIGRIAELPESARLMTGVRYHTQDVRSVRAKHYRIVYVYDRETLTVLRIFHVRQDIDEFTTIDFES